MNRNNRSFLTVFLGAIVVLLVVIGTVSLAVNRAGMIEIDVRTKGSGGCDITGIRVPAILGHIALALIPPAAFAGNHCDFEEIGDWGSLVRVACRELSRCPDFTLVTVESHDEYVCIRKQHDSFVIDVDSDDERVHLSVPLGTARAFVAKMDRCGWFGD